MKAARVGKNLQFAPMGEAPLAPTIFASGKRARTECSNPPIPRITATPDVPSVHAPQRM